MNDAEIIKQRINDSDKETKEILKRTAPVVFKLFFDIIDGIFYNDAHEIVSKKGKQILNESNCNRRKKKNGKNNPSRGID